MGPKMKKHRFFMDLGGPKTGCPEGGRQRRTPLEETLRHQHIEHQDIKLLRLKVSSTQHCAPSARPDLRRLRRQPAARAHGRGSFVGLKNKRRNAKK
jgi:hypothetical protein